MGRVFKPKYAWTKKDGTRVEKVTEAWYIEYTDASGRWIRRKAGTTKEQASDALRQAETDVLAERNGLPVRRFAELRCDKFVAEYLKARAPHISPKHLVILTQRLNAMLRMAKAVYVAKLNPDVVDGCLQTLADHGLSTRSQNCYLQSVRGLFNWAVRCRKVPYNPLDCMANRPEIEKRRVRRAMSDDEIARLLAAAQEGPLRRKQKVYRNRPRKDGTYKPKSIPLPVQAAMVEEGRRMVLAYRLMLETGLRKNEVRLLAWADLDLAAGTLTTRPEWEGNKNGKRETLPLPPGLVALLNAWREKHHSREDQPVAKVTDRMLRCFDDDLVAAGIAEKVPLDLDGKEIPLNDEGLPVRTPARWRTDKRDAAGRVLDLHALRHTYGTRLVAAGVDIKTVQALMRHSSPELTLGIYVHADKGRMKAAVAALPDLGTQKVTPVAAQAAKRA